MLTVKTYFPVIHTEVDGMGIVHHSNYPLWFEKGRRDYLKKAGIPFSHIADRGFFLPLSEMECKYKRPARYGDEIVIFTRILAMSCVKIRFDYEVFNRENRVLLAAGKTVHAWTNQRIEPINMEKAAPDIYSRLRQFSSGSHEGG
jgi:acyl-CoA thioester hydrolase